MRRILCGVLLVLVLVAAAACGSSNDERATTKPTDPPAKSAATGATTTTVPVLDLSEPPAGAKRLHFEFGPLTVEPGQNNIDYSAGAVEKPNVDGYIVGIYPNLRLADGKIPPVDEIHLHHGVWLNGSAADTTVPSLPERFFASGEEKTAMLLPAGYGYPYKATDQWVINYMIHNLWPESDEVWVTYDIDFVPADSPAADGIKAARPVWMDVQNGGVYPVFDVIKGSGEAGEYTYPDDATDPYKGGTNLAHWTADRDGVLIATAGHLHPGGLYTDLWLQRNGATAASGGAKPDAPDTAHVFRSNAVYYEPAGAVSWDVAMTATKPDWRVAIKKGDVLQTSATYDSGRASWYESMGIMVAWMADGTAGTDPFEEAVDIDGVLTHGHLAENDNHGGEPAPGDYIDLTKVPTQAASTAPVVIDNFTYSRGDMSVADSVPAVPAGGTLRFDNTDAPLANGIWHTITACKEPCNRATGIAYPLADGDVTFDSGELGNAGPPTAGYTSWNVPTSLDAGTYTYFCRIHPFMRGAFRVTT